MTTDPQQSTQDAAQQSTEDTAVTEPVEVESLDPAEDESPVDEGAPDYPEYLVIAGDNQDFARSRQWDTALQAANNLGVGARIIGLDSDGNRTLDTLHTVE